MVRDNPNKIQDLKALIYNYNYKKSVSVQDAKLKIFNMKGNEII